MSADTALPNFVRKEARHAASRLQLVHDLLAGTEQMWAKSRTGASTTDGVCDIPYIAKWTHEDESVYDIRRKGETVFQGLERTLSAAVGMLFAKPPTITWNGSESTMRDQWDNLDGSGTAGPVLMKRFAEQSLRDGVGAIVVDHPQPPIDPATKKPSEITADKELALGLRPMWALYARGQIINWRTATVNNRRMLTMIVFAETAEVPDGDFGIKYAQRYRVLRLVLTPDGYQATWTVYELKNGERGDAIDHYESRGNGAFKNREGVVADFLPVSIAYTGRTDAPLTASIPLMGVAWANLSHWQQSTDLRFYRRVAAFPQPHVKGELMPDPVTGEKGALKFGPFVAVHTEAAGDYEMKELSGTSMVQLESGIKEKLAQMGQLGLSFLVSDTRAAETADAKRLDATAQNSTLATGAQGIEDAGNSAWEHDAWYLGIAKASAPTMTISRDYDAIAMDAPTMLALNQMANDGNITRKTLLTMLQRGDAIASSIDINQEDALLDAQHREAQDAIAQNAAHAHLLLTGSAAKQAAAA